MVRPMETAAAPRLQAAHGPSLSQRWLGIDFRSSLPWRFRTLTVEHGTVDELMPFVERHYATMFGSADDRRWHNDALEKNKHNFIEDADIFLIRADGRTVGDLVGHPLDWSTYYLRSMALLPDYRGRGTYPQLMDHLADVLRAAGVERIEGDVTPSNRMNVLAGTRLGYVATGTSNSDRWGALVRMTKFLQVEAEDVFHDQFCAGKWPRRRLTTATGPERRHE
jgi:GNAT superfamily N-acetyltransferase